MAKRISHQDDDPFLKGIMLRREFVPSFDVYPYCIPAIKNLSNLPLHPKVTFFIGENGAGKSTLLEAIAVADGFNAEGGTRNFNFATRSSHSKLYEILTPVRRMRKARHDSFFLRAESFYNVATMIDELGLTSDPHSPYGTVSYHEQSHGEAFLTLFAQRFGGNGLYLLDEPESALSPSRQLTFLAGLHDLACRNSQLIIATHSPIIMAYPNAKILCFTETGIEEVDYKDTDHYKVTKAFMMRTERMLGDLMSED